MSLFTRNFLNGFAFGMLSGNPFSCCSNNFFMSPMFSNPFMTPMFPLMSNCSIFQPSTFNFNFNFDNSSSQSSWVDFTPSFTPQFTPQFDTSLFKQQEFSWNNSNSFNWSSNFNSSPWGSVSWGDVFQKSKTSSNTSSPTNSVRTSLNNDKVKNLSWWKEQGYNEEKGKKLAEAGRRRAEGRDSSGDCGTFVRFAVNDAFYNGKNHHAGFGHAAKNSGRVLSTDKNFKKIDVSGLHLDPEDVPTGAIVIYNNYSGKEEGHIEIANGKGGGYSDFESRRLFYNHSIRREPKEIWIPV